jgi:hypothetical protein
MLKGPGLSTRSRGMAEDNHGSLPGRKARVSLAPNASRIGVRPPAMNPA